MRPSFYQYSFQELSRLCEHENLGKTTASLLFNWYYKKNQIDPCNLNALPLRAKAFTESKLSFNRPRVEQVQESLDRTVKFLFQMQDGLSVETVLIPFHNKYTICLSSQVGCAMNCSFCFTGKQGFTRHLRTEEIINQILMAKSWLTQHRPGDDRILNVVFMGQGEPLHNFDAVKKAIEILISQHGLSLAVHKITVSTAGYLPGLRRWAQEMPRVNLALSLHSPFSEKRQSLIPIDKVYPLDEIMKAIDDIPLEEKRFITYEYLLIKGINDGSEDAKATGQLLQGKKAYLNLIPFNPFPGAAYERPEQASILRFKKIAEDYGVIVTLRTTKGDEILAACGQLRSPKPKIDKEGFGAR